MSMQIVFKAVVEMHVVSFLTLISFFVVIASDDNHSDDGGWFTDSKTCIATAGPCNIEIRNSSLTEEEFLERYAYTKPVIIRGLTDNSLMRKMSSRDAMLSKYGDKMIRLSSANTYSYQKFDVTLKKYIEEILQPQRMDTLGNETLYWFGDNDHKEWAELFDAYHKPPFTLPGLTEAYSFGVAGPGTGVPFHFHGPGFSEVIYGRKRWFFYSPQDEPFFHPDKTTLTWLIEEYPRLSNLDKLLECTVGPGEVIYFPDRWWHGTLNIDTSVFISTFLG